MKNSPSSFRVAKQLFKYVLWLKSDDNITFVAFIAMSSLNTLYLGTSFDQSLQISSSYQGHKGL